MKNVSLSAQDLTDIAKVVVTEVDRSLARRDPAGLQRQIEAVVDTITNRVASDRFPSTVRKVVNGRNQFTGVNGPKYYDNGRPTNAPGSVQGLPAPPSSIYNAVVQHVAERAQGKVSIIGPHVNFGNVAVSDSENKGWVGSLFDQTGIEFGTPGMSHYHGTKTPGSYAPVYSLTIPDGFMDAARPQSEWAGQMYAGYDQVGLDHVVGFLDLMGRDAVQLDALTAAVDGQRVLSPMRSIDDGPVTVRDQVATPTSRNSLARNQPVNAIDAYDPRGSQIFGYVPAGTYSDRIAQAFDFQSPVDALVSNTGEIAVPTARPAFTMPSIENAVTTGQLAVPTARPNTQVASITPSTQSDADYIPEGYSRNMDVGALVQQSVDQSMRERAFQGIVDRMARQASVPEGLSNVAEVARAQQNREAGAVVEPGGATLTRDFGPNAALNNSPAGNQSNTPQTYAGLPNDFVSAAEVARNAPVAAASQPAAEAAPAGLPAASNANAIQKAFRTMQDIEAAAQVPQVNQSDLDRARAQQEANRVVTTYPDSAQDNVAQSVTDAVTDAISQPSVTDSQTQQTDQTTTAPVTVQPSVTQPSVAQPTVTPTAPGGGTGGMQTSSASVGSIVRGIVDSFSQGTRGPASLDPGRSTRDVSITPGGQAIVSSRGNDGSRTTYSVSSDGRIVATTQRSNLGDQGSTVTRSEPGVADVGRRSSGPNPAKSRTSQNSGSGVRGQGKIGGTGGAGGGGAGGSKCICTVARDFGWISDETLMADELMGYHAAPNWLYDWYRSWAEPWAGVCRRNTLARLVTMPLAIGWATTMALGFKLKMKKVTCNG